MRRALTLAIGLLTLLPAVASAETRCVTPGGTGGCYATPQAAADASADGDVIDIAPGTYPGVNTDRILTFVGAGAGTIDSGAGATVLVATNPFAALNLSRGGTIRSLRAEGMSALPGDPPDDDSMPGGPAISFGPTASHTLTVVDVIARGGHGAPGGDGGGLASPGLNAGSGPGVFAHVDVRGGALLSGMGYASGGTGATIAGSDTSATLQGVTVRGPAGGSPGVGLFSNTRVTVEGGSIEAGTAAALTGATVRFERTALRADRVGLEMTSAPNRATAATLVSSLVVSRPPDYAGSGAAATVRGIGTTQAVTLTAHGSTLVGQGGSLAAVSVLRNSDTSPPASAELRNTIARYEGSTPAGVDLLADRAPIAADFSSFTTRTLQNGGATPEPGSSGNVGGDPMLAADFSLQPGSPLVDRGDPAIVSPGQLDLAGAARSQDGNGDCQALPDIGAFERPNLCPPSVANVAPGLASASMLRKVFAPTTKSGRISAKRKPRPKRGTRFRYTLSEPAAVSIVVERALAGRRSGRRCVKPTRKNRKRRRCTRYSRVTTLRANELAGRQFTNFTGRVRRRALKPGRYRARLVATDTLGARSPERKLAFRIVKP